MASDTYHEPYDQISPGTRDMHRAVTSLMEELEAIDWYQQRADVCDDDELRAILVHNKNEEIEHAMMVLEWIRRTSPDFDARIRTYLFMQGPITEVEKAAEKSGGVDPAAGDPGAARAPAGGTAGVSGGLGIGSLKEG
jgi:ferritin-like protein